MEKKERVNKIEEVEITTNDVLKIILKIIYLKEPYTASHSIRVAKLSYLIGKELNLSLESLKALKYASFLHDLGKIFIPTEILNKYSKLTKFEFNLVKEHVLNSYNIIKDINLPYPTKEIVLQHHERIDGSGYPFGLKGDEILLESKIIAVCDVIDAMNSDRPYRPKQSIEKIVEELIKNRGIKYDETVVDIAIKIIKSKNF